MCYQNTRHTVFVEIRKPIPKFAFCISRDTMGLDSALSALIHNTFQSPSQ